MKTVFIAHESVAKECIITGAKYMNGSAVPAVVRLRHNGEDLGWFPYPQTKLFCDKQLITEFTDFNFRENVAFKDKGRAFTSLDMQNSPTYYIKEDGVCKRLDNKAPYKWEMDEKGNVDLFFACGDGIYNTKDVYYSKDGYDWFETTEVHYDDGRVEITGGEAAQWAFDSRQEKAIKAFIKAYKALIDNDVAMMVDTSECVFCAVNVKDMEWTISYDGVEDHKPLPTMAYNSLRKWNDGNELSSRILYDGDALFYKKPSVD